MVILKASYWINLIKLYLKKIALINKLNAYYKSYHTRASLKKLNCHYSYLALKNGIRYDGEFAIREFKQRHNAIKPGYQAKNISDLRIFWVGTSFNQDNSGFLQSLNKISKVTVFYNHDGKYGLWNDHGRAAIYDSTVVSLNDNALRSQVQSALESGGIDVLIGQMWAGRISIDALGWVRNQGIPVINISMDDRLPQHWGHSCNVRLGSVGLTSSLDLVLTTSSETCLWYAVEGCPAIYWPLASDPSIFYNKVSTLRDIDVLFIGNKYGVREKIVNELNKYGINVITYGQGWPNGTASFDKSIELSNRAKIILGIGTLGHCDDLFTMKLRDFDAPMSGGLYLTHRNPDLTSLYKEGEEIEFYMSVEEAAFKIKHYLLHPKELYRVALNGQNKALNYYTWNTRLVNTFSRLGLIVPP